VSMGASELGTAIGGSGLEHVSPGNDLRRLAPGGDASQSKGEKKTQVLGSWNPPGGGKRVFKTGNSPSDERPGGCARGPPLELALTTSLDPIDTESHSLAGPKAARGDRTAHDLASLLVELSRLLKALSFYPVESAQRKALLDRTFLAWQADLARSGPLTLNAGARGFDSPGLDGPVDYSRIYNIASAVSSRRIQKLEFDASLTRKAFGAFAQLLAGESEIVADAPTDMLRWSLASDGLELTPDPPEGPAPTASSEAPAASSESAETCATPPEPAPTPTAQPVAQPKPPSHVAERPDEAPRVDRRASELASALEVLEDCDGDDDYAALSNQIASTAAELALEGRCDEPYHAALVLADHAVGDGGRSAAQARQAQHSFVRIAGESLLPDLISRACSKVASDGVRAARALLQLGKPAAPALFNALLRERDAERAAQLSGLFIALGTGAREELERQIQRPPHGPQPRLAIRLAGELQDPALGPVLATLLSAPDGPLRAEAAKALVTLGGGAGADALVVALSSPDDELAELAALCLGELRSRRASPALIRELQRTVAAGRLDCSREIARALGQIGAEEAVPRLASTLGLRGMTQRRKRRELKLAAVTSLGQLRSKAAHVALTRASRMGEIRVRERAQQILGRSQAPAAD
jgi:HEAT repeat protein